MLPFRETRINAVGAAQINGNENSDEEDDRCEDDDRCGDNRHGPGARGLRTEPVATASLGAPAARQTLGTAVFSGMIGVTAFGLIFTPAFYVICRWLAALGRKATTSAVAVSEPAE
jgi:hypothetical protein